MKTLILTLGPGASGKSTLSQAILNRDGDWHEVEATVQTFDQHANVQLPEKVKYTLGSGIIALAGNYKNGSDAIEHMDALYQVIELCWRERDVVIVDTVRSSGKFVEWMSHYSDPLTALFLYLNVSEAENINRLMGRRRANAEKKGKTLEGDGLPEKTYKNMLAFRDRASGVWNYALKNYTRSPRLALTLPQRLTAEESASAVHNALKYLRNGGGVLRDDQTTGRNA